MYVWENILILRMSVHALPLRRTRRRTFDEQGTREKCIRHVEAHKSNAMRLWYKGEKTTITIPNWFPQLKTFLHSIWCFCTSRSETSFLGLNQEVAKGHPYVSPLFNFLHYKEHSNDSKNNAFNTNIIYSTCILSSKFGIQCLIEIRATCDNNPSEIRTWSSKTHFQCAQKNINYKPSSSCTYARKFRSGRRNIYFHDIFPSGLSRFTHELNQQRTSRRIIHRDLDRFKEQCSCRCRW